MSVVSLAPLQRRSFAAQSTPFTARRVVVLGARAGVGAAIALAFARDDGRLVVHLAGGKNENAALADELAGHCRGLRVFSGPLAGAAAVERFARTAVSAYGGCDVAINIVAAPAESALSGDAEAVEAVLAGTLRSADAAARVAAETMRANHTEGIVLHVAEAAGRGRRALAVASLLHAGLAAMTRAQAEAWGPHGVRVNGLIADADPALAGELAETAVALAAPARRWQSGLTVSSGTYY